MQRAVPVLAALALVLSASTAHADPTAILAGDRIVLSSPIPFDSHAGFLEPLAAPMLDAIAALLLSRPSVVIEIGVHTDARGSEEYNAQFTERVARQVRDALIARHVSASRLTARGYGETTPIAPNTTAAGREANQRIELRVLHP
jgi:OmpA-OmpF porin, OOP family